MVKFKPNFWKVLLSITLGYYFYDIFSSMVFGGASRGLDGKIGNALIKIPGWSLIIPLFFIILTYLTWSFVEKEDSKMKAWLKGGLIAASIPVVLRLLSVIYSLIFGKTSDMGNIFDWIFIFATFYAFILQNLFGVALNLFERIIFKLIVVLPYFLIGALIGWIIGKKKMQETNFSINQ